MSASNALVPDGSARFCGQCGAPLNPGDRFCGACGAPVDGAALARPAPAPDAPPSPVARPPKPPPAPPRKSVAAPRRTEPERIDGRPVAAFMATVANWGLGWLVGGGIGAYVFAEILYRHARISGSAVPGIAVFGPSSTDGVMLIEGVEPGGILFWGLCGVLGGVIAAAIVAIADRHGASADLARHGVAALVWSVAIAVSIDVLSPIVLPLAAAAIGAWFGWRGETAGRSALWQAGAWFVGSLAAIALMWVALHV